MHHGANTRGTPAILAPVEINGRTRRTQFQGGIEFLHSFPGYSWTFVQFVESLNIQEALFLLLDRLSSFLSFHSKLYISITILYINIRGEKWNKLESSKSSETRRNFFFDSIAWKFEILLERIMVDAFAEILGEPRVPQGRFNAGIRATRFSRKEHAVRSLSRALQIIKTARAILPPRSRVCFSRGFRSPRLKRSERKKLESEQSRCCSFIEK